MPYLRAHLGREAASAYASALLAARPEIAPAFASTRAYGALPAEAKAFADHGTQLAMVLAADEAPPPSGLPADLVPSSHPQAKGLRCYFGRQLRAWGEPAAAADLRRIDDKAILRTYAAQTALREPLADSVSAARLALRLATGEDRPPARSTPSPRFFQYHVRHAPFDAARSGE